MFYYVIALFVIVLDQVSKWIIVKEMEYGQSITIIDNVLYITSHRNQGAAWGILQGKMWFFYLITVLVIIGIIVFLNRLPKREVWLKVALALMLGGAIGNFIDRVIRKEVVDFIHTYIFSYDFPIFNVADSSLVVGVAIMFIATIFEGKRKKE
ncbi:signal peptidase II [Priestia koreensis]|uniref:Lipoprotein signal peptidase n=1 Tax=Priestia koreensis TaxID=284581 RepID=A0A0M0KQQ0_9BACI|nr:signal peptidase II [Priestia koreensis]KOO40718.1 peptidase A8 [Priestia koreensis]MCM3003846.1 signal peptidase II [Priestia koreensis]UNL83946.1 signal peptidase II [Priestia koreensis]